MLVLSSCFLFLLVVARNEGAMERNENEMEAITHHYQTLKLSSFISSSICSRSANGNKKRGSLDVVHKHGPCSKLGEDMVKPLSVEEILSHDQSRVDSILNKRSKNIQGSETTLSAKYGHGEYIVTIGLGTPKKDLSLIFDTGSHLTWTQCQPCVVSCYSQQQPIYAPSSSTTYSNISCASSECAELPSATGNHPGCTSSTCTYRIQYGDGSITEGFFGKDQLTLTTSEDVVDGFLFGCGQHNQGLFRDDAAGILGLGRDKLSIVSQSANRYGKVFSYCLPSTPSSIGYLTFGSSGMGSSVSYTPLSTNTHVASYYGLDLEAIYVGGSKLEISPTLFATSGMIIDSGTVITRLPPTAYSALSKAFRAEMTQYPLTSGPRLFDTCYDLSKYDNVRIPTISMVWGGNVNVEIPPEGIIYPVGPQVFCLAFAGNRDDSYFGIFGNTQQKTLQVVYDVAAGKVGFSPGGCA